MVSTFFVRLGIVVGLMAGVGLSSTSPSVAIGSAGGDGSSSNSPAVVAGAVVTGPQSVDSRSRRPAGYDPSDGEQRWCARPDRVHKCKQAKDMANKALSSARDLFPARSLNQGKGDAYRHCYWSALMTIKWDAQTAQGFGDRHEEDSEGVDREMDYRNNDAGRRIGERYDDVTRAQDSCEYRADGSFLWTIDEYGQLTVKYGPVVK